MKRFAFVLALGSALACSAAHAAAPKPAYQTTWTGSWSAAPMAPPAPKASATAEVKPVDAADGTTYRDIVHLSLGGSELRLKISNEFGTTSLTLGSVHVALSAGSPAGKDAIQPASDHAVHFGGLESVTIPAGAMIVSDPVPMPVAAFADLAVSLFVPTQTETGITYHALGVSSNYIATGNTVTAATLDGAKKVASWYLLKGVDVDAGPDAAAVVTLGDSITDGAHATVDANTRWPNVLAARLQANKATAHIGVLDEGISGNRLLHDGTGPDALSRIDRDVLSQSGVKYLIILLGINDIGTTSVPRKPGEAITADQLMWALQQIVTRAHARGIKVYGATLTPYGGAKYQDDSGMKMHAAVNKFIRTSGVFDGVIDFEKMMHDPTDNKVFLAPYDSGDHLHPGDAGYKAMGDFIDLKLFQ